MAPRKTTFEVVRLSDIAPLLADAEVHAGAGKPKIQTTPARILSVTYDKSLAATRAMLFNSVGFQVFSAATVEEAIQLCGDKKFDLVVIGHSMPLDNRRFLISDLRRRGNTPLLMLHRPGEPQATGVDHVFDSTQSPALLLKEVRNILRSRSA